MLQSKRNYNHLMQKGKNQIIFLILSSTREIKSKNFAITEIRFGGRKLKKFKEKVENEKHNINSNLKQSMQYELVKRSLFGDNIQV